MTERAMEAAKAAMIKARDICLESSSPRSADEMVTFMLMPAIKAYVSALAEDDAAVEAVARAMCIANGTNPDWPVSNENHPRWTIWEPEARAAIRAMGGK